MSRHLRLLIVAIIIAVAGALGACTRDGQARSTGRVIPDITPTPVALSGEAEAYLFAALAHIEANALYRDRVDWPAARDEALRIAAGARVPSDTYGAIRAALFRLGDRHSRLIEPAQVQQSSQGVGSGTPNGRRLEANIGYLTLPRAIGSAPGYAETAQRLIREVDSEQTCGWVVDLRGNSGGNMWPMLAGVGPILGEGNAGAFVNGRGGVSDWSYRDGASFAGRMVVERVSNPYTLLRPAPAVAVLTSGQTASSGEAITVAFRGRPATRSFGAGTAGVPTANAAHRMSDGATIQLTVSRMADRNGRAYDSSIVPDEQVDPYQTLPDAALQAALAWLNTQPSCAGRRATGG